MFATVHENNISEICAELSAKDRNLSRVYQAHGAPPLWDRPASFQTILHIILEQQVSLASARACLDKLKKEIGAITPKKFLVLDDAKLKAIGFSHQKTSYGRELADALITRKLVLKNLERKPDDAARAELMKIKGIGTWTSDIYLLMVMSRADVMPRGDLALHVAWKNLNKLSRIPSSDEFQKAARKWKPFRSVAARLLWHFYLSEKRNGSPQRHGEH